MRVNWRVCGLIQRFAHRQVLIQHVHDAARCQHLFGADFAQLQNVRQVFVLLRHQGTVLESQRGQGDDFLAGDFILLLAAEQPGHARGNPHQRVDQLHQPADDEGGRYRQLPPEGCAQGLRDDFGEIQDRQRQQHRDQGFPLFTEHLQGLRTDPGGTHGVREGVEDEDAGERFIQAVLDLVQPAPGTRPVRQDFLGVARCHRQQHGFEYRAEKRHADGDGQVDQQQGHDGIP